MGYYGPEGYSWKKNTKCYFFTEIGNEDKGPIIAIPHDWLKKYDSNIPMSIRGFQLNTSCYLDLEKQGWATSIAYLIRDRYDIYEGPRKIIPGETKPYSIRKGDEDWCITYSNNDFPYTNYYYFRSFLLMKNINFSEFDAKIKAEGLECPVPYDKGIKLKDGSNFLISNSFFGIEERPCICVNCRKDYRAIEVVVYILHEYYVQLFLTIAIK